MASNERLRSAARAEAQATAWLLAQGFEVFRPVSSHAFADIVAWKDGAAVFYDVKMVHVRPYGDRYVTGKSAGKLKARVQRRYLSPAKRALGVRPLWVYPDGTCEAP